MSVCLNLIVKNEEKVLKRCLNSVAPYIDTWVIVDTGSTDNTLKILEEFKKVKPGHIRQIPWEDYSTCRTKAIRLAQEVIKPEDYLLFIDADETFQADVWPQPLILDCYEIVVKYNCLAYVRSALVRAGLPWEYHCPVHEYLDCSIPYSRGIMRDVYEIVAPKLEPEDPIKKYQGHADLLKKALEKEPNHPRNMFYLAQSYRDAGMHTESLATYEKRSTIKGWDEEDWYSLYQIGTLKEALKRPDEEVILAYLKAYEFRPNRAEPLHDLARFLRLKGRHGLAYVFAEIAANLPLPSDRLFVTVPIYTYGALDEWSIAAYYTGRITLSRDLCDKLLQVIPESERERIKNNKTFAETALKQFKGDVIGRGPIKVN